MLSIVIPTYRREQVLIDTIESLQPLRENLDCPTELLVIDQTEQHNPATEVALRCWSQAGVIRWLHLPRPHLTKAMNTGLKEALGDIVLYLDDDIIPDLNLLSGHLNVHGLYPEALAVVGQVLQPGQFPRRCRRAFSQSCFWRDLDFPFNSVDACWIENVIACNLSLKRFPCIEKGGFDECFPPPVASRFETEFAKRLVRLGGKIRFEPSASIRHLAAGSGGTRSRGSHLTSASPRYGVGDCYFAFRCATGLELVWYLVRKPFREVRTKFHLLHPWWVPVKFIGEIRALLQAWSLARRPPSLIDSSDQS
ncbi:MAG: glycosyltransferase [Cyanobacteriota bacterium]|nr:glycosyltransferase [Cyanobacteriota bacterium]